MPIELINTTFSEINEKAGKKIFSDSDRYSPGMDGAAMIVSKAVQRSGILLEARDVNLHTVREGMVIGEDNGAKGDRDKGRYKGIDHIVFVLRDPGSRELMISQSRGGEGVELLPLDDYLAYKHKRGTKLFASDPLAEARSLLLSEKDYTLQTPGVGTKSDHRDGHEQEANLSEQAQTQATDAPVALKRRPLLSEPGHPDYLLYVQSYDRLKQLSTELGFKDESAYVNAAASIAVEAKAQNLKRVDHVLLSTHGLSLFAVQGKTDDPGNQWIQIDKAAAVSHAVQLSTIEVDVLRQKRQEELSLDTEFRTAMIR